MPVHIIKCNKGIKNKGGAFWCSNMRKNPIGGILADYRTINVAVRTASTPTSALYIAKNWAEQTIGGAYYYWMKEDGGTKVLNVYVQSMGRLFKAHVNAQTDGGNGLLVDFAGQLLYVGKRYIGRTVTPGLIDGTLAAGANTVVLLSVTGLPTAGELFISDGADSEVISYTGIATKTLTGVTRGLYDTVDHAHSDKYVIGFDDDWLDLGAAGDGGIAIKFQDYILVSNGTKIAGWKVTDGSDLDTNLSLFEIPGGYTMKDFSLITTGAGERVLIAANKENEGVLFVWDVVSADWDKAIWVRENITKLCENFVGMDSGLYKTDGYTLDLVAPLPDDDGEIRSADFVFADIKRKGNFLIIAGNNAQLDRNRTGIWILDLIDLDWFFVQPSNGGAWDLTFGGIFISSQWDILISHNFGSGAIDSLSTGPSNNDRGNVYQVIYDPQATRVLRLRDIKLGLDLKIKNYVMDKDFDFSVIVRYYTFSKVFLQYSQISGASGDAGEILLNESNMGLPAVGDRIEIIERTLTAQADVAGQVRNITAVATAGGVHTCSLDEDLSATPGANLANAFVTFHPLYKIEKKTFTGRTINHKDLVFTAKGQPEFKKMLIEVEFINDADDGISPGLSYIEITSTPTER
jgi:hypothetical protein